jgi:hypothetical protein
MSVHVTGACYMVSNNLMILRNEFGRTLYKESIVAYFKAYRIVRLETIRKPTMNLSLGSCFQRKQLQLYRCSVVFELPRNKLPFFT